LRVLGACQVAPGKKSFAPKNVGFFPSPWDKSRPMEPAARFWNTQNVGSSTPCRNRVAGRHLARRARSTAAQLARRLGA
jgi:hypothetical protein